MGGWVGWAPSKFFFGFLNFFNFAKTLIDNSAGSRKIVYSNIIDDQINYKCLVTTVMLILLFLFSSGWSHYVGRHNENRWIVLRRRLLSSAIFLSNPTIFISLSTGFIHIVYGPPLIILPGDSMSIVMSTLMFKWLSSDMPKPLISHFSTLPDIFASQSPIDYSHVARFLFRLLSCLLLHNQLNICIIYYILVFIGCTCNPSFINIDRFWPKYRSMQFLLMSWAFLKLELSFV